MKTYFPYSLLLAAAASGLAYGAETAYTTPVGYEKLAVAAGVNFLGLRMQQPAVVAGKLTGVSTTSVSDTTKNFATLLSSTKTYILEIKNANGVTQEFLGSAGSSGGVITTTPADLSAKAAVNDRYIIREAPTLASTFGIANSAGLETGFFGPGGDIVLLPNPATAGGFDQFYYDAGQTSWADVNGSPVDGAAVAWNYADAVLISATGGGLTSLTVSGEVKIGVKDATTGAPVANTGGTGYSLQANAVNFLSSVSPVGATLASSFNNAIPTLDQGFFGPGGDIFFVVNPATNGGFDQYYYDGGQASWADVNGSPIDATTVNLTSGILIYNDGAATDIVNSPPATYSTL